MAQYTYDTVSGLVVADTSNIKAEVQAEYVQAFGPTLLLDDSTPQGRLIDVETTARDAVTRNAAEQSNQINPEYASGIFLESICALHDVIPVPPSRTLLPAVKVIGIVGTVINEGSRVADQAGNYYASVQQVVISDTSTVDFLAVVDGPLNPAIGSVTTIIDGTYGWTEVDNAVAADPGSNGSIPGVNGSSDADLRVARRKRLSKLAKGPIEAVYANVLDVPGVRSLSYRENRSASPAEIDGVTLSPSSTWVCVQGGADTSIAMAILASKQSGSPDTSGTGNGTPVNVMVTDSLSGQVYPVVFTRPILIPIAVRFTIATTSVGDPEVAIPDAVLKVASGEVPGVEGFIVGADVSPFELASAVNLQLPAYFIKKVEVGTLASGPIFSVDTLPIALWQQPTILSANVSVVVA